MLTQIQNGGNIIKLTRESKQSGIKNDLKQNQKASEKVFEKAKKMLTTKSASDIIAKLLATQKQTARPTWKFDYLTSRKKAVAQSFLDKQVQKEKQKSS